MEEKTQRKWARILATVLKVIFWVGLFVASCFIPGVTSGMVAIIFGCMGYIAGYVTRNHKEGTELAEKLFKEGKVNLKGITIEIVTQPDDVVPEVPTTVDFPKEEKVQEPIFIEKPVKKNKKKRKADQTPA